MRSETYEICPKSPTSYHAWILHPDGTVCRYCGKVKRSKKVEKGAKR